MNKYEYNNIVQIVVRCYHRCTLFCGLATVPRGRPPAPRMSEIWIMVVVLCHVSSVVIVIVILQLVEYFNFVLFLSF
jgi:hypothetical protein